MSKIALKDQFEHPTMLQNHETGDWNTTIGRRNIVTGAERIAAALCANPEVCDIDTVFDQGQIDDIARASVAIAKAVYREIENDK